MEMALKKRSAGPSALGKDAQAQEIQDLKKQLSERDAEIEKMKERSNKEDENLREWKTPLQRYMADRSVSHGRARVVVVRGRRGSRLTTGQTLEDLGETHQYEIDGVKHDVVKLTCRFRTHC
jgi:hypothetical protein